MKGSRAASGPSGSPEGSSEGVDLSLTGLPPPVSRRPNSASAAKPLTRSSSVVTGSEPRTKVLEGPGGARTINNLRRSSSTTQVCQPPAEHPHFLTFFEGGSNGKKRPAGVSKAPSEKGATWNVLDDQPRAFALPPDARSPSTVDAPVGPRRRECTVPLAPSFTANNRSNKGAVGNCVTGMVHNHYTPSGPAPPPKSSNPNILKAAAGEGESRGSAKPHENLAGGNRVAQNDTGGAPLRRKEVTEEEAERFIHQVNRAAVTVQRWYRRQVQRRGAGSARPEYLLASKPKGRQLGEGLLGLHQQKEAARKKAREEKARQARRAAIQELQQKRAQKSGDPEPRPLEDARETEKPRPAQEPLPRPGGITHAQQTQKANNAGSGFRTAGPEDPCQSASNSSPEPRQFPEDKPQVSVHLPSTLPGFSFGTQPCLGGPSPPLHGPRPRPLLLVRAARPHPPTPCPSQVQQRDLTVRRVKETEKELGRQLRQQREHYEATIQRHLSFIDQLIEDKKALADRCEAVVAELKQGDQRRKDREAQVQEQHELEMKKLKELMSATEKVRREKWINEKTRKIKEITVRGLEPEIQKLIAKHKQEVKKLKSLHEAELLQADARAAQRFGRQVEELREQLEREKEALGRQERERAQQRFEQHVEQEQRALQQQRRRLYGEVAEEKERLGQQAARQRAELEELRQQLEESSAAEGRALRAEFEKGREEQERRHQMEMKALKEELEAERQMWEANCAKKEEAWLLNRERELRDEVRRGRDKEIELVIHRLEADMTRAREESQRAAESRVQRIRDQHAAELSELERAERTLQERCSELKGRLGEAEGESGRLRGLVRQKEKELARRRPCLASGNSTRWVPEAAVKRAEHLEELLEQRGWPLPSAK
uniref:Centrosomal protein 131 n=1 Tax=Neovison vison TaxID=452646 RepID=A0A8C7BDV7_NEOVI